MILRIPVLAFLVCTSILSASAAFAQTSDMVVACKTQAQRAVPKAGPDRSAELIRCFQESLSDITMVRDELRELAAGVEIVRGKSTGDVITFECSPRWYDRAFGLAEQELVQPAVTGGVCGEQWNTARAKYLEYYSQSCVKNEPIYSTISIRWDADRLKETYVSCFNDSIPRNILDFYVIKNREDYLEVVTNKRAVYRDDRYDEQYGALGEACNDELERLMFAEPGFVQRKGLTCAP